MSSGALTQAENVGSMHKYHCEFNGGGYVTNQPWRDLKDAPAKTG